MHVIVGLHNVDNLTYTFRYINHCVNLLQPLIFLCAYFFTFLADRTNGHAYASVLRLSSVVRPSVTLCIVAKRCVLEQKLLLRAYRKSYMRNRLVPK